jgi:hypothetical protein
LLSAEIDLLLMRMNEKVIIVIIISSSSSNRDWTTIHPEGCSIAL